jgi:hypothetical protein
VFKLKEDTSYRFELQAPEEYTKEYWESLNWLMGGGTMLVYQGKNLVATRAQQRDAFIAEGWFKKLSTQTQETQLQDWVRGPRMIIGMTKDAEFFMFTFDGRSASVGATFAEAIAVIYEKVGKDNIEWAINLDGGSSVGLSVVDRGKPHTVNLPAIGPDNWVGQIRPINTFGMLVRKTETAIPNNTNSALDHTTSDTRNSSTKLYSFTPLAFLPFASEINSIYIVIGLAEIQLTIFLITGTAAANGKKARGVKE